MSTKIEEYMQLADKAAVNATKSFQSWVAFLETIGRLYKYPYSEQIMIHAQRPDATACADYDLWNQRMKRFIRKGSKGITLIDTSTDNPKLHYVFDVSDTVKRAIPKSISPNTKATSFCTKPPKNFSTKPDFRRNAQLTNKVRHKRGLGILPQQANRRIPGFRNPLDFCVCRDKGIACW